MPVPVLCSRSSERSLKILALVKIWLVGVELDPDIEEHSPSDPNDALGAPSPEMTKSSEKGERDEKAVLGLSFMEKEQEKITLQPNIYRKENKQHQIENQRL
jgi:hypothetical protein